MRVNVRTTTQPQHQRVTADVATKPPHWTINTINLLIDCHQETPTINSGTSTYTLHRSLKTPLLAEFTAYLVCGTAQGAE